MVQIPLTTPEQIAEASDGEISAETVRRFLRAGRFPSATKIGQQWFITVAEAEQFLSGYDRYKPDSFEIRADLGMHIREAP